MALKTKIPGLMSSDTFIKKSKTVKSKSSKLKKSKKSKEKEEDEEEGNDENIDSRNLVTIKGLEMPEGVDFNELENEDDNSLNDQDPHKALSKFTLDEPLVFEKKKKSKSKKLKSEKGVKSKAKEDRVKSNITIS